MECVKDGKRKSGNGKRKMENGKRNWENGVRKTENGNRKRKIPFSVFQRQENGKRERAENGNRKTECPKYRVNGVRGGEVGEVA